MFPYDDSHAQNRDSLVKCLTRRAGRRHWPEGLEGLEVRELLSRIPRGPGKYVAGGAFYVAALSGVFGLLTLMVFFEDAEEKCTGHLMWKDCVEEAIPLGERLPSLVGGIVLILFAAACVVAGLIVLADPRDPAENKAHLQQYIAILHGHESMKVAQIASITGRKTEKVRNEIQTMIDTRMISEYYIDYGRDLVVSKKYVPPTGHKTVVRCQNCKAHTELIVGIPKVCSYCREPLIL